MTVPQGINIDEPRYPQTTYINRAKHFLIVTNPLVRLFASRFLFLSYQDFLLFLRQNVFASEESLNRAARIVKDYKAGLPITDVKTEDELWSAKYLYDSAFHPDTGVSCGSHLRNNQNNLIAVFYWRKKWCWLEEWALKCRWTWVR